MLNNLILHTDSYKLGHWNQYPAGTEGVYSYLEAREGAEFPETVFFGLQSVLKRIENVRVTQSDVDEAAELSRAHFGTDAGFNRAGWEHIVANGGTLPLRIKAVPEGTPVPVGNVLMTVENTDPAAFWLTNAMESFLLHVWYPTTVATLSRSVKKMIAGKLDACGSPQDGLGFMLHDFGYRGVSSDESAERGGMGHLVNFVGTDTLVAMQAARRDYGADLATLGFSVPATEHSVMTALGRGGEYKVVDTLLNNHPAGILSVVADSYNIYEFVKYIGQIKDRILARDGVFVVRPDSTTLDHQTPGDLVVWILRQLEADFGTTTTPKGFKVLDSHVRVLWGDGIDPKGIEKIINAGMLAGFCPENFVFGMGGGLLQKVNRDTQRFAFKSSAQKRGGVWHDIQKKPLDQTKLSKSGRLALIKGMGGYATVPEGRRDPVYEDDVLQTVFEDGELRNVQTFEQIRERASL